MSGPTVIFFSVPGETYFPDGIRSVEVGNTAIVAKKLGEILGCDVKEIEPKELYPLTYNGQVERAKMELANNDRPEISQIKIDSDVVFLLYPNWCSTIPMPVATFLDSVDWKGKKIHPLCTNEGSGMGRSVDDIRKIVPDAVVSDGLSVRGHTANECDDVLKEWVSEVRP